jgi:hypothetical protein
MTATIWNYFNGGMHGWNGPHGYVPSAPMTHAYCSACGPKHIPGFDPSPEREGRGHWDTGFRCAPWRIGRACDGCGVEI